MPSRDRYGEPLDEHEQGDAAQPAVPAELSKAEIRRSLGIDDDREDAA